MKIEDFRTLDVVDFSDGSTGIVYVIGFHALAVSQTDHTWCSIRETRDGLVCDHGTITAVRRPGHSLVGNICAASRAGKFDWLDPSNTIWSAEKTIAVKIGSVHAGVRAGKWSCEGVVGDLADAEKVLELFTEPDKPKLEAYDLVQIGEDEANFAAILPSPDKHEGNFAAVCGRITLGKWIPSGRTELVDFSDRIEDGSVNRILRWDNVNYAFGWFNGGGKHMYQAKEVWARKQTVRIANTWDARRIGDIVKVGCQEVTLEQVEELIRKLKETAK